EPMKRVYERVELAQLEDFCVPEAPSVPVEAQGNADSADRRQHDGQLVVDHDTGKEFVVEAVDGLALAHVPEGNDTGRLAGAYDPEKRIEAVEAVEITGLIVGRQRLVDDKPRSVEPAVAHDQAPIAAH